MAVIKYNGKVGSMRGLACRSGTKSRKYWLAQYQIWHNSL